MSTHASLSRRRNVGSIVRLVAVIALVPTTALACLWDYDTLRQERSKFPDALELITGKFLRHSPEFYEWRIKDRLEKLKTEPNNLAYHDDLAVAYSKVGRTNDAIATMEAKDKIKPGLYETNSNLGTFYILAGEFEKGLPYIDKALAINPDAHFGREKYQKWLVEYALTKKGKDGKISFPLQPADVSYPKNFLSFVQDKVRSPAGDYQPWTYREDAIKGVLGMMRFANHENPLLLEALGDLLVDHYQMENGNRLAARAYLQASYQMKDDAAREKYRKLVGVALDKQMEIRKLTEPSPNLEDDFRAELAEAKLWYDELHGKELAWIRDGGNVDAEFDRLYTDEPKVGKYTRSELSLLSGDEKWTIGLGLIGATIVGAFAATIYIVRRRYLRRRALAAARCGSEQRISFPSGV
jgi:tetratricopeptide (TPR) repeat protein